VEKEKKITIDVINEIINGSLNIKKDFFSNKENINNIKRVSDILIDCYNNNGKTIIFGNGGSAADSQHFAAEMVVRFEKERRSLPCIALSTDTSILTASANDYSFDFIFSRQIQAFAQAKDVVIAISTSGNSKNVLNAVNIAKEKGLFVIALTGCNGGMLSKVSDISLIVNTNITARIQEVHIMIIHIICKLVEDYFFEK